jgi:hypothetical protein
MSFGLAAYLGALAIGAGIGVLTGMFGVGGGFLITPLLNVFLGVPMSVAVGTGVLQILGVSTAGIYRRRHERLTDYKLAIVLFGGNYVGVHLGARSLRGLAALGKVSLFGRHVSAADFYTLSVFFLLLLAIAIWLVFNSAKSAQSDKPRLGLFARICLPPYTTFDSLGGTRMSIPVLSYFGVALGFLTGLLGIGGGVVLLPALVYLVGMRTHGAAATSLVMVWLTSFLAAIAHTQAGNTDILLAAPLLVGGSLGLQVGVTFGNRMRGYRLRRVFGLVVLVAVALIAGKLISLFF